MRNLYFALALIFVSGAANGLHETLRYHWPSFQNAFPHANERYWNPYASWTRKWKDGDPEKGEAFPLSSTALVVLTDAKHLLSEIHRDCLAVGMWLFGYWYRSLRRRHHFAVIAGWCVATWLLHSVGFHAVYTFLFCVINVL